LPDQREEEDAGAYDVEEDVGNDEMTVRKETEMGAWDEI